MTLCIHPLLEATYRSGSSEDANGSVIAVSSAVSRQTCEMIYRLIEAAKATRAIEVGMAFGISSLAIADALRVNSSTPRLVSIDPHQSGGWRGAGRRLLERAGRADGAEVVEKPSHLALPELSAAGARFDFALIDGWHTFDHALLDFFFIDTMLETGGIIVFDDVGYPSINAVVSFVLTNRSYRLVDLVEQPPAPASIRLRRAAKRVLRRLARTDRDPSPEHDAVLLRVRGASAAALVKTGDDVRSYDHFARF